MEKQLNFGDLQLAILRELWRRGEATVAEVHESLLPERGLAPTTIATMLTKMEKKGVVSHRTEGRRFVYRATVSEEAVTSSMVAQLTEQLFQGEATALVSHLIAQHDLSADELTEIRQLVAGAQKEKDR